MTSGQSAMKILDLFCGCGGLSLGMDMNEGFNTVIGVDFNSDALKTFKHNFPEARSFCADITDKESFNHIVSLSNELGVNMIMGGPPCQGFSLKGKKLGLEDPRNFLFKEYFHYVEAIQPEVFVVENVVGLLTSEKNFFIEQIKTISQELGYHISYDIMNAVDFGVPQNRKRAIIIGSKGSSLSMPAAKFEKAVTVREAISDLSYLSSGEGEYSVDYTTVAVSQYQKSMRTSDKLYNHVATKHSDVAVNKLKMIPAECGKEYLPKELHGKQQFSTTWSRLEWDKPSPTIDTRFDTPSNGKNSHPYLHRAITIREAARIQSFPDDFVFLGKKTEICKQVGNAVPPLLAKAIGEEIAKQIII